jgi:diketogulonate reductase-like aldo/keto reductase
MTWIEAMSVTVADGLIEGVGVSNYSLAHIEIAFKA